MSDYCAPADRPLSVLHVFDPSRRGKEWTPSQVATSGWTMCGLELVCAELWQLIERQDGDTVCHACLGEPDPEERLW